MPNLFANVEKSKRQQQIEALVHFLTSTGNLAEVAPATSAINRGKVLFRSVGCLACHDQPENQSTGLTTSVPLGDLASKYSIPGLANFLDDPLRIRPSGRMPKLTLNNEEAQHIASYLLKDIQIEPFLQFRYYEGNWQKLPDFSQLKPKASGKAVNFDVNVGRENQFAIRFTGLLQLPKNGDYTFHLRSDDGSRLLINQQEVVKVDGIHPVQFGKTKVRLAAGTHDLVVEFFEQGGGQELRLELEGPGIKRQPATYFLIAKRKPAKSTSRFVVDPDQRDTGKRLFVSLGCVSCHQLQNFTPAPQITSIPDLSTLATDQGCLVANPQIGLPFYALAERQRQALSTAIKTLQLPSPPEQSAEDKVRQTLTQFNCFACHKRGQQGGVEPGRNALFLSTQNEMGDEGRLPPSLTGVGAKLRRDWLKTLFNQGSQERPYMLTRMPRFGTHNLATLIPACESVDTSARPKHVGEQVPLRRLTAAGRQLAGTRGFSCIKCHTFAQHKATGIQAINLTSMTRRLKENWFHHYLLNPQAFRPGTRMPASWPNGQVLLPKVLNGDAQTQVHAIWTYLTAGEKAALPVGLLGQPFELIATDEPVIYRNFIAGAGPRAIGIGYPEKVNLAFDANQMRLGLVWHNAFIDASKHWRGRGQGFQQPLGDNVLQLPPGVPFAMLTNVEQPWPQTPARQQGYRFGGYQFNKQRRPTLRYRFTNIQIEDYPFPASAEPFAPLIRQLPFTAKAAAKPIFFRAVTADKIEALDNNWFQIDDTWRMQIESASDAQAIIRNSRKQMELLVPVMLRSGKERITQTYVW